MDREAGMVRTAITTESLDRLEPFDDLSSHSDGAVLVFQGRVRDVNDGRPVTGLKYEAYGEMAEKELRSICEEACSRYEVGALRAVHRVGELELGEVSVVIAVAAPHRVDCYEASRFVIEELKKRLPVWKHERYREGDSAWIGAPDAAAALGGSGTPGSGVEGVSR